MKKIIINGRFLTHRITGVERFAREILNELDTMVKPGRLELAVPKNVKKIPTYKNIQINRVGILKNKMWEHISFPYYVFKKKGISLNLCNVAPLVSPGIVCIHDVKVKARPHDFSKQFLLWYRLLLKNETKRARKILTVSKFSKKELGKYYKVNANRIEVIYNGWQHYAEVPYDNMALKKYSLEKFNYYFSMCSLEPNKKFKWVAEEAKRNPDQIFAVAGSINKKVFSKNFDFECPSNMKLLGYVSDEEAKTLMKECKAFLFPTFYEGFGIPPLEAIAAGCKNVVVSDTEVMHELFDNSVSFIKPKNYNYNLNNLVSYKKDPSTVLNLYSWHNSARKLLNMLIREKYYEN